jgi:putative Mg2+ transporter-C (MgtC) family protein
MPEWVWEYAAPLGGSIAAGALIGFEREYRGRPAGFRTHILVCLASALLMIAAIRQVEWMQNASFEIIRIDPVRMAHGILTGIGFLCGGVIFREGLSVHGLTTAASLWITSALGTLYGVGFYGLAVGGTLITVVVLAVLRWCDDRFPSRQTVDAAVRYRRSDAISESEFKADVKELGFTAPLVRHRLLEGGQVLELASPLRAPSKASVEALAQRLGGDPRVIEFELMPRD